MPDSPPPVIVVMGVAGTGKTTVGALLAGKLGWRYAEADEFHSAANVAKMAAGQPLTDDDRAPWLAAIGRWIDELAAEGTPGVVSCSGLRRQYRDQLREGRPQVRLVFLDGSRELITRRLAARHGHFMRVEMLDSQFAALEPPQPDEDVLEVSIAATPEQIVDEIVLRSRLH
ncbi:gluconokinase [Dactylosporangium sp. NPDC000521]|uniref:gluconokinase n=1 Tax=Dactylosporangium sp. NPDC000521 TaxID=3363975 RepID=UPI00367F1903